jgi:hypothetical protein
MAKCSAHGTEIGTIYTNTKAFRYMSDGAILKNIGFGWKLHARIKPGFSPSEAFTQKQKRQLEIMERKPALRTYRKALHDLAGIGKRWKLEQAISMMPDDPDGVWSTCCDSYADNVHADIGEIVSLCQLYKTAIAESQALAQSED